jgi:hypothetical protein
MMCDLEIVWFNLTWEIDDGRLQHNKRRQPSPRLVFWFELGSLTYML